MITAAPAGEMSRVGPLPRFVPPFVAAALAGLLMLAHRCPAPQTAPASANARGSLGATFRNDRPKHPAELSWPEEEPGAVVETTVEGGPAYLAGWRAGDRIGSVAGSPVLSACQLERQIAHLPVGKKVEIEIIRDGAPQPETSEIEPIDPGVFERLCQEGKGDACTEVGRIKRVANQVGPALTLYEQACEAGDAPGCSELAGNLIEQQGDDPQAFGRMAEAAKKGCDGGFASACAHLALLYATGRGVPHDDAHATSLYELACDGGDPQGCFNVGLNYEKQRGVPRNDARSLLGYVHGCEGGAYLACTNLGYLYDQGIGVIASPERAARLYERACEGDLCTAGDPLGCANFGIFLRDGRGVAKDEARAVEMFERACATEVGAACNNLGILVEDTDAERALELYRKACRLGSSGGCKNAKDAAPKSDQKVH